METEIAGVRLAHPIMNAAGPRCVTREELETIGKSHSAAIVTKSCTFEPREGNPEPRYKALALGSINSMGLPNLGYEAYLDMLPALKANGKPLIVSVSGLSLKDNLAMIEAFNDSPADLIELNLSCPNVPGKPQVGYDPEQTREVLREAMRIARKPLGVKLPPYFDFVHYEEIASILNGSGVAFVVCVNSIGNALVIDPETETTVIRPKGGFGGLGGTYLKPIALANVRKFRELLDEKIAIVGVGGITTGTDVFEFILAGADAVQLGTVFMEEGPGCFARINGEFEDVMRKKGYASLDDYKGKLRSP